MLIIDDDADSARLLGIALRDHDIAGDATKPEVIECADFSKGVALLEDQHFDLLILDLRLGSHEGEPAPEAGIEALDQISKRQFLPVIFFTGLPHKVPEERLSALTRVVEKSDTYDPLFAEIRLVFDTHLPAVNRALGDHVREVQRSYMWDFVLKHWDDFGTSPDHAGLAYFLARRLAISLNSSNAERLVEAVGGDPGVAGISDGKVHVHRMYVMPPIEGDPALLAGALVHGTVKGEEGHFVLLTPSCDMYQNKAEWIVLAKCEPLLKREELTKRKTLEDGKKEKLSGQKRGALQAVLDNKLARHFFLPAVFELPALIVDFQHLVGCTSEELGSMKHVGSLDSPFAEALVARFTHYFGRIGTPDIDTIAILNALDA